MLLRIFQEKKQKDPSGNVLTALILTLSEFYQINLRKLKRFSTKIERNIDDLTGDVNCEIGGIPAPIIHPKIANEFSDKLWHVYNHYFRGKNFEYIYII